MDCRKYLDCTQKHLDKQIKDVSYTSTDNSELSDDLSTDKKKFEIISFKTYMA